MSIVIRSISIVHYEKIDDNKVVTRKNDFTLQGAVGVDMAPFYNAEKTGYNLNGINALSDSFIRGLSGVIHYGHQNNLRDSAEHLRAVIQKLEQLFIEQVNIKRIDENHP